MNQVQSKYKNPDKHIGGLKNRIERLERVRANLFQQAVDARLKGRAAVRKQWGDLIVNWADSVFDVTTCSDRTLGDLHAGDRIVIVGKIMEVREYLNSAGHPCSSIKYRMLETRRVEAR